MIHVTFESGLQVATPVSRFPRLQRATPEERAEWRLIGKGDGIHWPAVDEDISVRGLFLAARKKPIAPAEQLPALIGELFRVTKQLDRLFTGRPFTPDGHLVGSIGEVVADYIYGLELAPCSTPRIDAHTKDHKSVQIKLTGEKGTGYGIRWSSSDIGTTPDILLCLKLTREGFVEVYNGPFPLELLTGKKDQKNGQIALSVRALQELNPSLLPLVHPYESINQWFAPQLADVA